MGTKQIEKADFSATGYSYPLSLIAGKYKPIIIGVGSGEANIFLGSCQALFYADMTQALRVSIIGYGTW